MSATNDTPTKCASCETQFEGRFCPHCGEEVLDHHDLSTRHFVSHTLLHEFTHVDGKIGRTVRYLLLRPGFLSSEYVIGRRVLYINPLRVLLTAALIFALAGQFGRMVASVQVWGHPVQLSMLPPSPPSSEKLEESVERLDLRGVLKHQLEQVKAEHDIEDKEVVEKFNRQLEGWGEVLSFCSVIPLSLVLWVIYRKRRPFLVEHLIFAMHLEAFLLILAMVSFAVLRHLPWASYDAPLSRGVLLIVVLIVNVTQWWYLYCALMRFYHPDEYGQRYRITSGVAWRTALAWVVVFVANSLFLSVVHLMGAAIALRRL